MTELLYYHIIYYLIKKGKRILVFNNYQVNLTARGEGSEVVLSTVCNFWCTFCLFVCFLPIYSGHQVVRWTYQPGSHRRKVTQDFSPTFLLRCVP